MTAPLVEKNPMWKHFQWETKQQKSRGREHPSEEGMDGCEVEMLIWYSTSRMTNQTFFHVGFKPISYYFPGCCCRWMGTTGVAGFGGSLPFSRHVATGCFGNVNLALSRSQKLVWESIPGFFPFLFLFFFWEKAPANVHNLWENRNGENMLEYIQILEYIPFDSFMMSYDSLLRL